MASVSTQSAPARHDESEPMTYKIPSIECDGVKRYFPSIPSADRYASLLASVRLVGTSPVTINSEYTAPIDRKSDVTEWLNQSGRIIREVVKSRSYAPRRRPTQPVTMTQDLRQLLDWGFSWGERA